MNGYAISFDMDVRLLEQHYGYPYNPAYAEIRTLLKQCGFSWVQGSTYVTAGTLVELNEAIMALKSLSWFCRSVRDIRAFRIEEWSDFTSSFKKS